MSHGKGTRADRRATAARPREPAPHTDGRGVPGKRTLTEGLSAHDPAATLELLVASLPHKTAALARAVAASDFLASWRAASELTSALDHAEHLASSLRSPASADVIQRLAGARAAAEPLLANAPSPSPEAIRERSAGKGHAAPGRWEAEEQQWRTAHSTTDARRDRARPVATASAAPDLGNYDSAVGKQVLAVRAWDNTALAARRVELQGRLARTTEDKARNELLREHEAIEWVARERHLPLPKDPAEQATPQAFMGGTPIKFSVPDTAQGMRAMLEREMAEGSGYATAREHAQQRIAYSTLERSPSNNDKRLIGEQQTALMDHDAAAFRAAFQSEARQTALSMLDASSVAIDSVLRSYGIAGGSFRLTDAAHKVAKDPDVLEAEVARWLALSRQADGNHAAFTAGHGKRDGLAREAEHLRGLQDNIAVLAREQLRLTTSVQAGRHEHAGAARPASQPTHAKLDELRSAPQPLRGSATSPFDQLPKTSTGTPEQQLAFVRGALRARHAQFKAAWIQAEREHPILAAYRAGKGPDASTLAGIGTDEATTRSILQQVLPKLANIYRTKAALQGAWGTLDPLQLAPVVELTKQRMFVAESSYRDRVVHDMAEQAREKHGGLAHWAFEAVMLGLTLVTLVPTAGASAAAGLALTGLAYDLYAGLGEYEDVQLASAAADTDLDKIRSLSDTEPSLTPLLTRILSAGVNFATAASLFKRAAALRRLTAGSASEREAIAALNKAGEEVGVKRVGDEAIEALCLSGAAASPRVSFRPNPNHEVRSLSEALQIAERNGIEIDPERFRFAIGRDLPDHIGARYFDLDSAPGRIIEMKSLLDNRGRFVIRLNPNILNSDDKILGVIAHEAFEIEALENAFIASGGRLEATRVFSLIDAEQGSAHSAAWDHADKLIEALQRQGRYP